MAILGSYKSKHTGKEIDDAVDKANISVPNTRQINGKPLKTDITLNKNDIGLNNVDNTSDKDKPISTATQNALNLKANTSESAYSLDLSINEENYIITISLKNKSNEILSSKQIDLPLESVVVNGSYNSTTKTIVLTLKNGNTVEFSVADLISGLQKEITLTNKLSASLVEGTTNETKKELDKKINIAQGSDNSNKVFMTDNSGNATLVEKLPSSVIPSSGVSVDTAQNLEKADGTIIKADNVALKKDLNNEMNKTLYNLGAFDTVTDNEDGTVTITRKTGYATFDGSSDEVWQIWDADQFRIEVNGIMQKGDYGGVVSNRYETTSNWSLQKAIGIFNAGANVPYQIFVRDNTFTLSSFIDSLKTNPLIIQYELAAGYTEKVIKNQRNNAVDDFSRGQWEKTSNLFDKSKVTSRASIYENGIVVGEAGLLCSIPLPKGTYSLGFILENTVSSNATFIIQDGDTEVARFQSYNDYTIGDFRKVTFTISTGTLNLYSWGGTGGKIKLMLNEGDQALPYQPFDYSGHIQNEQGRYLIEHEEDARNLISIDWINYKELETTIPARDYYLEAGKYICTQWGANTSQGNAWQVFLDGELVNTQTLTSGKSIEFNIAKSGYYSIYIYCNDGKLQGTAVWTLNKGDKPLPYTPYNSKEHITNLQADLLELEEKRSRNVWDEQWEQGMFDGSGQPAPGSLKIRTKNFIQASPNTAYTLCYPTDMGADVYEYDENENFINYINCSHKNTSFTTKSNTKYLKFRLSSDYGDTYKRDVVLVKGTEALPYEPYEGQIIHETDLLEAQKQIDNKFGGFKFTKEGDSNVMYAGEDSTFTLISDYDYDTSTEGTIVGNIDRETLIRGIAHRPSYTNGFTISEIALSKDLDAITKRLDDLGFKQGVVYYDGTAVDNTLATIKKQGKIAILNAIAPALGVSTISVPAEFKPKEETTIMCMASSTSGITIANTIKIKTDGTITTPSNFVKIVNAAWEIA